MSPERIVVAERAHLVAATVEWIATAIADDVRSRGRCAVALSGGSTPRPVYERLAEEPFRSGIAWSGVEFYFGDERAVPPSDPRSNYAMARAALFDRLPGGAARAYRMEAEHADRDAAARAYEALLPPRLDLLLLGVGDDGHTASLFPGSPALDEQRRRVVPATGPTPPRERLTITPPVIADARRVGVLVAGAAKASIVARALRGPAAPHEVPVQLALGGAWFVDTEAAARLTGMTT